MVTFIVGFIVGALAGVFISALAMAAHDDEGADR